MTNKNTSNIVVTSDKKKAAVLNSTLTTQKNAVSVEINSKRIAASTTATGNIKTKNSRRQPT